MLLQFSATNYKSIKDTAVLSMVAGNEAEHPENWFEQGGFRALKSAVVFGANASGKSNLIGALTAAVMTVRMSGRLPQGAGLPQIVPFLFAEDTATAPTCFEFIFIIDGIRYVYGFSATRKQVVTEYLYRFLSAKRSTVFERDENGKETYRFTDPKVRRHLSPLVQRNTAQMLFLTTASIWNAQETQAVAAWFMSGIETYSADTRTFWASALQFANDVDDRLKAFASDLLHQADINIDDYYVLEHELDNNAAETKYPVVLRSTAASGEILDSKAFSLHMVHRIRKADGSESAGALDIRDESQGTQDLFLFSPFLKRALDRGAVICVDELGASMHPLLTKHMIELFHDAEINQRGAQLIFTSHQTELMQIVAMRRDQFYFTEKDPNTGGTELFALDAFSPRKQEDIRKAYLTGRYGAVPHIRWG